MYTELAAIKHLNEHAIAHTLLSHPPVITMADVLSTLSIPEHEQVKTLALSYTQDGVEHFLLCGLRAQRQLDIKKVSTTVGISRSKLNLLNSERIQSAFQVERGAIGIAHGTDFCTVLISQHFDMSGSLYFGAGLNTLTIKVNAQECIEKLNIQPCDIEKDI